MERLFSFQTSAWATHHCTVDKMSPESYGLSRVVLRHVLVKRTVTTTALRRS